MKYHALGLIIILLLLTACAPKASTIKIPACNFYENEQLNQELGQEIWGEPMHAAFNEPWRQAITSLKLSDGAVLILYESIENINKQQQNYINLEKKLISLKNVNNRLIEEIKTKTCRPGPYAISYKYIIEQTEGIESILRKFPNHYSDLEWCRKSATTRKEKEKKLISSANRKKEFAIKRQEFYREYKGTKVKAGSLLIQVEDFIDNEIYISISNESDSKIQKLFTKNCIEYNNEQGGVSCSWETNASLLDQYNNSYKLGVSDASDSIHGFDKLHSYNSSSTSEIYPNEKKYFKLSTQKTINGAELNLYLNKSFLGYESNGATFKFPDSFHQK